MHINGAPPVVLTIAGFDPTSGAGVTADIKTLAANNCYGVACVTAYTVQNTEQTKAYWPVPAEVLEQQLDFLLQDLTPRAIKIGMLGGAAAVDVIARKLERQAPAWVVLDPILRASSGVELIDEAGRKAMLERLLPLASVITPNVDEAAALTGVTIRGVAQMEEAAVALSRYGVRSVVITGGHLEKPVDLLYEDGRATAYSGDRVRTTHTHGTGCTFATALTANLALGRQVGDALVLAKAYVTAALKAAYGLGNGRGPLNHLFRLQQPVRSQMLDHATEPEYVVH
jgi:hydroxymethylpyrimidine/phosphomethylpyrimidine kinase